jgi:uncharacterized C2H2 Zn-finger protein
MTQEANKQEISEQVSFKKPEEGHVFLFCGTCALLQRSDNIYRHFSNQHTFLEAKILEKGRKPLFPFT